MVSPPAAPSRWIRHAVLAAGVAIIVAAASAGCVATEPSPISATSIAVPSAEQTTSAPSASQLAKLEPPLPVPQGETVLAVLDPAVVRPATSADEALALAHAAWPYDVGASPSIQLVRLAFLDPGSDFEAEWTGWIILSTDVRWHGTSGVYLGPSAKPAPTPYGAYTWIHVSLSGKVIDLVQEGYENVGQVPPTPTAFAASSHQPTDVEGTFNGDYGLMANCTWVTDATGQRWELIAGLPDGYATGFEGRMPILTHEGEVVARVGDRLGLNGVKDPPDLGSFCMVGRVFQVTEVVWIER